MDGPAAVRRDAIRMKEATMADQPKDKDKPIRSADVFAVTDIMVDFWPDGSVKSDGMFFWMSDDAQLRGLMRGERTPRSERKWARALPGQQAKGIPLMSLPGLLAKRQLVPAGQEWRLRYPPAPKVQEAKP